MGRMKFSDVPRVQGEGIPPVLERAIRVIREAGQHVETMVKAMSQVWMSPALSDSDGAGMKIPGPRGKQGRRGQMGRPGMPGEVFQLPIFGQPRDNGKLVLLQSQTAATSATIDFLLNRQPSSRFTAYMVVFDHVAPATDGDELWLRTSTNAGSSYDAAASDYDWARWRFASDATTAAEGDTADSEIGLVPSVGNASNETNSGVVTIFRPSAASYFHVQWQMLDTNQSNGLRSSVGVGRRLTAADVDGIRFMFSTGNIASGEFRLYGLLE